MSNKSIFGLWICVPLTLVLIDQLTKNLVAAEFVQNTYQVLPILSFTHLCNTGAAFGILPGAQWLLISVGVLFVGYFSWEIWSETAKGSPRKILLVGYCLILAGALGNLIDRSTQGCVTDFIFLHYSTYGFPVFNVADMCITFGAIFWIWTLIRPLKSTQVVS